MDKSRRLTLAHVRAVGHLIDECRELGDDLPRWRNHLLTQLVTMLPAQHMLAAEFAPSGPGAPELVAYGDTGWPVATSRAAWEAWMGRVEPGDHPAAPRLAERTRAGEAACRRELLTDREWYDSSFYDWFRESGLDDGMLCMTTGRGGAVLFLSSARVLGDRPFAARDAKLLGFVQTELARHLGRSLATSDDAASRLSPRLRQTLDCLLDGDGEKQAALRMGLSLATIREYVQVLYRRFDVTTRAELMAQFLRRYRRPPE
jgi:DNA-binding CsgD family transcriptional regulator